MARFWTKDPHRLPCPVCKEIVEADAGWKNLLPLRRVRLECMSCGAELEKVQSNYGSVVPLVLIPLARVFSLDEPWIWLLPGLGLGLFFWLLGKEIQSARLIVEGTISKK